jgi:hypothetical protein
MVFPVCLGPNRKNDPTSGKISILEFILQKCIVNLNLQGIFNNSGAPGNFPERRLVFLDPT